jgi:large subunit ribosomal protein L21
MYAVIKTGGKQYRVAANDKIQIEKLQGNPGDRIEFAEVLMVGNDGSFDIGAPFVKGATVVGEIASIDRGPKILIFKKRRRKHYRRKNGHRQDLISVTITDILTGGAKASQKAAKAEEPATELEAPAAVAAVAAAAPEEAPAAEVKAKKPAKPRAKAAAKPKQDNE